MVTQVTIKSVFMALVTILVTHSIVQGGNDKRLKEFRELFSTARRLESAEMLLAKDGDQLLNQRKELLFAFASEPKSAATNKNYLQMNKIVNEYRAKALQYLQDSQKKSGNWLTKIVSSIGGPLGGMKGLSKSDSFLNTLTESYESLAKSGSLNEQIINQDLAKFQTRGLDMIMFVLATDLKYLVTENVQILNSAIYQQLKMDKFLANNNFYDVEGLTSRQQELLRDFYLARVNTEEVTVGEAVEHYEDVSNLIIGRLLDSCHAVVQYRQEWEQILPVCGDDCLPGGTFSNKHDLQRYSDLARFCEQFLEAL